EDAATVDVHHVVRGASAQLVRAFVEKLRVELIKRSERSSAQLVGARRGAGERNADDRNRPKGSAAAHQYFAEIGSSSAGNSVITRQPLSVTTTSSSMRAAEKPSVAGQ